MKYTPIFILFLLGCLLKNCSSIIPTDISKAKIAYNVLENESNDDYEIYIMNTDGTGKKNISNHPGVDWVYYSFKDKLFFISDRDTCHRCYFLYEMDANGGNIKKITDFRVDDSWFGSRKNGKELIVRPWRKENNGFYIIRRNGIIKEIILNDSVYKNDPMFLPGGQQIVFRMKKDVCDELWMADANGTNERQLTHFPPQDSFIYQHGYHAGSPRFNQAEGFISYQSKQHGKYSLYAVTPNGKKQFKLTENELEEGWHDWSTDGQWLALEMFNEDQTEFDIYLMNYKDKSLKKLTDHSKSYEQAPVFVYPQ